MSPPTPHIASLSQNSGKMHAGAAQLADTPEGYPEPKRMAGSPRGLLYLNHNYGVGPAKIAMIKLGVGMMFYAYLDTRYDNFQV